MKVRAKTRLVVIVGVAICCWLPASGTVEPLAASAAECTGDECQGPPPAPQEVTPGTAVVEGPPNPPVHYPKVRKKHPKNHHGKHGRHHRGHR
jgi:hypothetical protein